jgi:hypothetical protein
MRTVLIVAACTLCLAFTAHGAEPSNTAAQLPATPLPVAPAAPSDQVGCIQARALVAHTAYTPVDGTGSADLACCATSRSCAQFLSTQALLKPPVRART